MCEALIIKGPHPDAMPENPADAVDYLVKAAWVVERARNYGTHLLVASAAGRELNNESAVACLIYRSILVRADAAASLIRLGSVEGVFPIIRSQLEATLFLDYVLRDDSARRVRSYRYWFLMDQQKAGVEYLEAEKRSAQSGDGGSEVFSPEATAAVRQQMADVEASMASSAYTEIAEEYARMKKAKVPLNWYSVFGGPRNLRMMAEHLGADREYVMYKHLSGHVHAAVAVQGMLRVGDSVGRFRPLRWPENVEYAANLAAVLVLRATKLLVKSVFPEQESAYASWYMKQMRKGFLAIQRSKLEVVYPEG